MRRLPLCAPLLVWLLVSIGLAEAGIRDLSFEDRVKAQEAIERIYYGHRIGAAERFETTTAWKPIVERKVRLYLEKSVALEHIWKTPVTREMLHRELERMAMHTRMPERLTELYAGLNNDPLLIEECVARPALVDRLVRNFHEGSREPAALTAPQQGENRETWRRRIEEDLPIESVRVVGSDEDVVPLPRASPARVEENSTHPEKGEASTPLGELPQGCSVIDQWDRSVLSDEPRRRTGNTAVWTGTSMIIWGGRLATTSADTASGARYDPTTDTWSETAFVGAPSPRSSHSAVWTGSLMIVWGGSASGGGRYDPVNDSWLPVNPTGGPATGEGLSAIWTGRRMIVWGVDRTGLSAGGSYDPVKDRWKSISMRKAPLPRHGQTVVWTGKAMIVWGGLDAINSPIVQGGRYYPSTNKWRPLTLVNAPQPRWNHTAIWTGQDMIIWGGYSNGSSLRTGALYNPTTNKWRPTSIETAPDAREAHSAIWTGHSMLVWGGVGDSEALGSGGRYDPIANSWSEIAMDHAPAARFFHSAIWTGNLMIVWGGDLYQGGRYDPKSDQWTPTAPTEPPLARAGHSVIWTGNLMIVWGGLQTIFGGGPETTTGSRYDPVIDVWTPTAMEGAPSTRSGQSAVWTGSEMIIWGGTFDTTGARYDPDEDAWTPTSTADAPVARSLHTAVWTGSSMIVWGGLGPGFANYDNTGGRYDPASDSWSDISPLDAPSPRYGHSAVWTGSSMVVWGGASLNLHYGDGASYDPKTNTWSPIRTSGGPEARSGHAAVWTGERMIVWGGGDDVQKFRTGGQYDPAGDTWRTTSTLGAPSGRSGASAVWTGEEWIIWGGSTGVYWTYPPFLGSGARYAPATDTWTPMTSENSPSPRAGQGAIWTGFKMILWGGIEDERIFTSDGAVYETLIQCDRNGEASQDLP